VAQVGLGDHTGIFRVVEEMADEERERRCDEAMSLMKKSPKYPSVEPTRTHTAAEQGRL
jgi:hypothetical protein